MLQACTMDTQAVQAVQEQISARLAESQRELHALTTSTAAQISELEEQNALLDQELRRVLPWHSEALRLADHFVTAGIKLSFLRETCSANSFLRRFPHSCITSLVSVSFLRNCFSCPTGFKTL